MAQIFESVSGTLSYGKGHTCTRPENEVRRELTNLGCSVTSQGENYFRILGNLSQIRDLSEWVMKTEKEKSVDSNNFVNVAFIPMSHREYKTLEHFANQRQWFKKCWNSMKFEGHGLTFDCLTDDEKKIEEDIKKRLEEVKMMTCISTEITDESKDLIKELAEKYPNVCLVVNDRIVDIISDSYEDVLKLQDMLKPKAPVKSNRRAARTFAKAEDTENQGALSSSNDGYNAEGNAFKTSTFTSQPNTQSGALELKTAEGFIIKIYTGSITRLNVDCIVNAANENLMHGGGVAAAISEAAGYQFDQESAQYIADNGPIPVGSCCVTSAGKLPYKCVIHTVGPRWSGYRDSNVCLELLQKSVEVSFKTADMEGMNSVAIPAISSGIFGVPRDKCVEQYYKAAMSFCSTYPCKSLREIHFVDRDESMVRAIQTVFESKEPIKTSNDIKNTESANGNDESSILNKKEEMPPTENSYTIVTVSDSLQIKLHMGSITDIVADVIVCPQEKFCTSNNQIARDIFRKDPGSKPTPGKREIGDIFSRIPAETSPWKEIIHAVFPIYNEEYSKDPINFGKTFNAMLQEIFRKADNGKFTAIAVPFFIKDKDGYKAPVYWCALDFLTAVTSKGKTLKDIYIVVQNEDDEKTFLDACKANRYEITPRSLIQPKRLGTDQDFGKTLTNKPDKEDNCCICMDTPTNPKRLKCGHIYCKECIEQQFAYKPACPSCGQIYGKMTGDQPPGTISIRKDRQTLQGVFDSKGCILLTYSFSSGYQGEENPHPGQWYKGIQRSGYVPNNERGRLVAKLLNVAFSRRLVFTIGRSRTTGEDGVITWNDIHHKTRHYGGSEKFGYPDPTYLDRVLEELAAKGVTPESADDPQEYTEYSRAMRY